MICNGSWRNCRVKRRPSRRQACQPNPQKSLVVGVSVVAVRTVRMVAVSNARVMNIAKAGQMFVGQCATVSTTAVISAGRRLGAAALRLDLPRFGGHATGWRTPTTADCGGQVHAPAFMRDRDGGSGGAPPIQAGFTASAFRPGRGQARRGSPASWPAISTEVLPSSTPRRPSPRVTSRVLPLSLPLLSRRFVKRSLPRPAPSA